MNEEFKKWLAANGYDVEALSKSENAKQLDDLEAAWKFKTQKPPVPAIERPPVVSNTSDFDREAAEMRMENERIKAIQEITLAAMRTNVGNSEKCDQLQKLCDLALADKKVPLAEFKLQMLYADRSVGLMITTPRQTEASSEVVEAAICLHHKLANIEKHYKEATLEAAHKHFRRGMGIKRLLLMGARANGYRGDDGEFSTMCKMALRPNDEYGMSASVGVSTGVQVPGILSNIANKFLATSFMYGEQSWRQIAKIRPVNDFKQITTYRMSGANAYKRVSPSGEIKHGSISELSYTNQAKTYGTMLGISREDYINDDLSAFVNVLDELGRGGNDALNNAFWTEFLDDLAFFTSGNANFDDGAVDSVLSLAGLDNAESIFRLQTKPDGTPLGSTPRILLVPVPLKNTALQLMASMNTNMATSSVALTGNNNIFAGRFIVVDSAYLSRTTINDENGVPATVAGSSLAWYLLADPMDIPCIEVVFLYGKEVPTVETSEFEFDRLGLATRAIFDFGVRKQEKRGGVKMKGAA